MKQAKGAHLGHEQENLCLLEQALALGLIYISFFWTSYGCREPTPCYLRVVKTPHGPGMHCPPAVDT